MLDDGDTNTQHSLEPSQVFIAHVHKQKPHVLEHTSLFLNSSYILLISIEGVIFKTIVDKFWDSSIFVCRYPLAFSRVFMIFDHRK